MPEGASVRISKYFFNTQSLSQWSMGLQDEKRCREGRAPPAALPVLTSGNHFDWFILPPCAACMQRGLSKSLMLCRSCIPGIHFYQLKATEATHTFSWIICVILRAHMKRNLYHLSSELRKFGVQGLKIRFHTNKLKWSLTSNGLSQPSNMSNTVALECTRNPFKTGLAVPLNDNTYSCSPSCWVHQLLTCSSSGAGNKANAKLQCVLCLGL